MQIKNYITRFLALAGLTLFSSCELVEGIFKAGMWTGILMVVLVIGLVIWLIGKIFGGKR